MSNKLFGSKQQHSSPPPAFYYNPNSENIPPSNVLTSPRKNANTPQKVSTPRKMLANMKAKVLRKPFTATEEENYQNDATSTSSSGSAEEQVPVTPQRRNTCEDEIVSMDEALAKRSPEAIPISMDDSSHKIVQVEKKLLKKASAAQLEISSDDVNLEEVHKDLVNMSEQLSACVFDKQFSDFVIQCGPGNATKYYVHRFILSSRSAYFRALLSSTASVTGDIQSNKQRYTWEREDIHPEIFGRVLEYMYTGQIKLRLDNVLDVFVQSEEFGIPCLKKLCENYLIAHGDYENMAQLLEMAIENKAQELVKHCYKYIDEHIKRVLKSETIKNVKTSTIIQIISRDSLQLEPLEEVLVFEAVQKWAELRKHLPFETPNISKIIEHVRYPLMSSEQLANVVEPTQLVPQHPLLFEAYKYHLVKDKSSNQAPRFRARAGASSQ
ncbi:BTB domain-containing protein [Naegleria gruberi]|uniref:BTB domain-containing protein n=1 Tax=Naegleria gruberi TaxID=5762 RepID=D2VSP2_NAEGR|nr:BTB domain-containing protein [Naegleria gruberi]EFC40157.1 BTB domain-containing protein [Naegleria gruberi]|eukprot:XP_002672901.1 BTB domain-containing protein [Naegleria gruberi strain NEG-M]